MKERNYVYRKEMRIRAIAKKKRIYNKNNPCFPWNDHDGKLSKGKVHCSCPMCRFKGTTMQDLKIIEGMLEDISETNQYFSTENRMKKVIGDNFHGI